MLVVALLTLSVASVVLVWQGTLPLVPGFIIAASSIGTLLWKLMRLAQMRRSVRKETRARKAKWGGELLVITGLSSLIGMHCRLFITRQDALILDDGASERTIHLDDVRRIGLFYGETVDHYNDVELGELLKIESIPHFSAVRAWLSRNPGARKNLMLAIIFQKPLNDLVYSEMAVFSDFTDTGNLKAFAARPEVAVKLVFIPHSRKNKRNKKSVQSARKSSRSATSRAVFKRRKGQT
ncbi:MAG: hypothetical protein GX939_08015 [Clostridiaceae bacterium]|jgi:hypothetical protein|nr:hypothetical protein [Clostridiaceae bacterium]